MNNLQKAQKSIEEAIYLLKYKSAKSTTVERYTLLYKAWDELKDKDLSQPLQMGKGLYHILSNASTPVKDYDLLLGRCDDHVPTKEEQAVLDKLWEIDSNHFPIVKPNLGHRTLEWKTLIDNGITGYLAQAELRLEKAKSDKEAKSTIDFLEGMIWIYKGILVYIRHYAEAAKNAGLSDSAMVCENLAIAAPKTFREAMQLILFVYNIYLIYAGAAGACLNVGRLDDMLLGFYLNDLQSGALTEEDAGALIDDFSAKMSFLLGRGEHQMAGMNRDYVRTGWRRNPAWDSPGYITLGGYSNTYDQKTNPLTLLFAKHIHHELKNPVYVCRYTADSYDELWDILYGKIQKNASLLLYNDETMIPAQKHIGVDEKDAVNYSIHPCNWPDITGDSFITEVCGEPLPTILNKALNSKKQFACIDEIYEAAKQEYAASIKPCFERYRKEVQSYQQAPANELLFDDCFSTGVIASARSLQSGGSKYPAVYVLLRSIGTATDMLCAVDTLVFKEKKCTLADLLKAADEDFENDAEILGYCRTAPKYGTNDEAADMHASRLMNELLDVIDREATNSEGIRDVYTLNVTINDSNHIFYGMKMGATVDGRRSNKPLSENLGPTVGYSKGVTALLNSVSKLPFDRIHSGAFNIRLARNTVADEVGILRIKALIKSYFEQGGMQIQVTIADTEELRKAQETPDDYRDLLVRITGYSAIFVDMSKGAQEEYIKREELK